MLRFVQRSHSARSRCCRVRLCTCTFLVYIIQRTARAVASEVALSNREACEIRCLEGKTSKLEVRTIAPRWLPLRQSIIFREQLTTQTFIFSFVDYRLAVCCSNRTTKVRGKAFYSEFYVFFFRGSSTNSFTHIFCFSSSSFARSLYSRSYDVHSKTFEKISFSRFVPFFSLHASFSAG